MSGTTMRKHAAVLLPLLIYAPVLAAQLAPVPSHATRSSRPAATTAVVARVNGVALHADQLDAAMQTVIPLASYHQNVKPEKMDELRKRALDGLIDEELRYQEALRLKIQVAPAEVEKALERARQSYKDRDEFDRARRASGATMPQVRASILRALLIQKAYDRQVVGRCRASDADAGRYYRENTARFILPEQVRPTLITIGVDPSAPRPEWDRARQKANDIARRIAAGASFETLAREHSTDASKGKGGDLGFVHRGQLIEDFERALRALKPGQVSPVIQTIYGFHLLRLVETRPPVQKTFEEMKPTIVRDLTETRCGQASRDWSKRLRDAARIEIGDVRQASGVSPRTYYRAAPLSRPENRGRRVDVTSTASASTVH
jgi:parvulin-like peptidyl-prolyl isomerase